MALAFANLNAASGLQKLNDYLLTRSYITGYQASKDDIAVYAALNTPPSSEYVNAARWYNHIDALLRLSGISEEGKGVKIESTATLLEEIPATPAVVGKAPVDEDDDDDVDLFGEETEEEKKAAEERAAAVKASSKKKESGKSSVLLDVKPWDDETDMKKLEEAVRSIQMEGLLWGASKLAPVGYGIKKLQIMMTIVDDLVSVDNLIEEYLCAEPANEHIQSCDIVAFNKILQKLASGGRDNTVPSCTLDMHSEIGRVMWLGHHQTWGFQNRLLPAHCRMAQVSHEQWLRKVINGQWRCHIYCGKRLWMESGRQLNHKKILIIAEFSLSVLLDGLPWRGLRKMDEHHEQIDIIGVEREGNRGGTNKFACACAIIASIISILMGYDTGVMSGAMLFMKEDLKIKDGQVEVLAGIMNICALVGSLTAGRLSDWLGRRCTIVVASVIFLIGSVLMGIGVNFAMLFSGRCVAGVGVGYALMVAPVYSAEISSPATRGFLTSLPEICISFGILLGYVSNYFLSELPLKVGWRVMLGVAAVPSAALGLGVLAMPESPRWLVMQGRVSEAKAVLLRVSNTPAEAELRLGEIKAAAGITATANDEDVKPPPGGRYRGEGVWKELLLRPPPHVRRILVAALGIHFFEHATGIEAVVLYSPRIFKKAGVEGRRRLLLVTMGMGVTKLAFILVATCLIDRVGRRPLLLSSVGGMVLCLLGLGSGLTVAEHGGLANRPWAIGLSISSVFLYVASFSAGMGPVTWVYSSEIFPLRLRAQGASLGVAVNRVMNGVVSMTFISLYKAITIGGAFFMFAGIAVVAWIFFFCCCPETKGRSLEETEAAFIQRKEKKEGRSVVEMGNNN